MESYSDRYERLKKDGVEPALIFFPELKKDEEFREITDQIIPGIIENRYVISNFGNVYDKEKNRFLHESRNKGYKRVSVSTDNGSKNIGLHRLEMLTFNYRSDYQQLQVNHIDGNPGNNNLSNLEWTTPKENSDHAMLFGLHKMKGENNPNSKLTEQQVHEICKLIESGEYYDTDIAKMYNISYTNVSDIHKGKIWKKISKNYNFGNRKPISLTEQQVHEICKMLESGEYYDTDIAKMFNITSAMIGKIRRGECWTNISCNYNINKQAHLKFTDFQIEEICKLIESGEYYDTDIAKMYNTTPTFISDLRKCKSNRYKDIINKYDMTIRKSKLPK